MPLEELPEGRLVGEVELVGNLLMGHLGCQQGIFDLADQKLVDKVFTDMRDDESDCCADYYVYERLTLIIFFGMLRGVFPFIDVSEVVGCNAHLLLESSMKDLAVVVTAKFTHHLHFLLEILRIG